MAAPTKPWPVSPGSASRALCGPSWSLALSGLLFLPLYPEKSDRTSCSSLLGGLSLSREGLACRRSWVRGPTFIFQRHNCCWYDIHPSCRACWECPTGHSWPAHGTERVPTAAHSGCASGCRCLQGSSPGSLLSAPGSGVVWAGRNPLPRSVIVEMRPAGARVFGGIPRPCGKWTGMAGSSVVRASCGPGEAAKRCGPQGSVQYL